MKKARDWHAPMKSGTENETAKDRYQPFWRGSSAKNADMLARSLSPVKRLI